MTEQATPLTNPPNDGITDLQYVSSQHLLSASWDGCLRLHNTQSNVCDVVHALNTPLLCLSAPEVDDLEDLCVFVGGLDGSVRKFELSENKAVEVGKHEKACSCVAAYDEHLVCSGSWDKMFYMWDSRCDKSVCSSELPGKAFSMDLKDNTVVVACSDRRLCIFDIRYSSAGNQWTAEMTQNRESSLKFQTRTVRMFPDGEGLAIGSIEGRVAVEFVDEKKAELEKKKRFAFKCHRVEDTVYPVNVIAFHPTYGTFATGGCDGTVVLWDGLNKKRLTSLQKFPTSIAALAFNSDGSELAVASSYTWEDGERDHPRDEIYVRKILDQEIRPKQK